MGVARGLERRLERLVDGFAARLFRGRVHPVELGTMLVREADLALVQAAAGPTAPNVYRITMGGDEVEPAVLESVSDELSRFVHEAATDRGWRLEGPPQVTLRIDPGLRVGHVSVETGFDPGDLQPWAVLEPLDRRRRPLLVAHIRSVVGRSSDADVRVPADTVSRSHAVMWQEGGAAWIADLGSANGTYLNGERVTEPTPVVVGDIVGLGDARFTVREP